ncbi:MAG: hypothetical protein AAF560_29900, partial [Acidobacteriota bacterium]
MKILWIATKAPWPPVDGGRRVLLDTLHALGAAGHRLTLVAPVAMAESERRSCEQELAAVCEPRLVAARPRPRWLDGLRAQLRGMPWTVVRHALPAVRREVETQLGQQRFDAVIAEQLQALAAAEPAAER